MVHTIHCLENLERLKILKKYLGKNVQFKNK